MGNLRKRFTDALSPVLSIVVLLGIWQLLPLVFDIPALVLPTPTLVARTLVKDWNLIWPGIAPTLIEIMLGFLLSVVVGIPLAILIVSSRLVERLVYPLLVSSQMVPKVALAPLFVIWFGYGLTPKVIIAFLIGFFPVVIDTVVGLRMTEPELLLMARSMGAGPVRTFFKIRLMKALPSVFGGFKVAITLAVVGAIVGEFISSNQGLGYTLLVANGQLKTPLIFAVLVVLVLMGVFLFLLLEGLERLLIPSHIRSRMEQHHSTM